MGQVCQLTTVFPNIRRAVGTAVAAFLIVLRRLLSLRVILPYFAQSPNVITG